MLSVAWVAFEWVLDRSYQLGGCWDVGNVCHVIREVVGTPHHDEKSSCFIIASCQEYIGEHPLWGDTLTSDSGVVIGY